MLPSWSEICADYANIKMWLYFKEVDRMTGKWCKRDNQNVDIKFEDCDGCNLCESKNG